jgi:Tol biopolymer transport system component
VLWPAFSPDGKQFAFSWNVQNTDRFDIYLQLIGQHGPQRLTTAQETDYNPVFSPDGRWIAFLRYPVRIDARLREAVFIKPLLGGPERMIAPVWAPGLVRSLAWSGDGRWLIVAGSPTETEPCLLMAYPLDGRQPRRLTNPPPGTAVADTSPVLSPDGRRLAFLRNWTWDVQCCGASAAGAVFALPVSTDMSPVGMPVQVSAERCCVSDVAWARNGEILYVVWRDGAPTLMRSTASAWTSPYPVASIGPIGRDIVVSPHDRRMAFSTSRIGSLISSLDLRAASAKLARLISWSHWDLDPRFSPDGKKIAFISGRSGPWNLWVCDADGSNPMEIASLAGGVGNPQWSPDGSEIAFDGRADGNSDVWVIPGTGGRPRRLTHHPANDINPAWSHDGQWIYFSSSRTGREQIFKTPAYPAPGAREEAIPLTRNGGHVALESRDGRYVYFMRTMFHGSIWRMPAEGVGEVQITSPLETVRSFELTGDGIWFQSMVPSGFEAAFYRFATARVERRIKVPVPAGLGFTISPAHRLLFATTEVLNGDLWLVENFR